MGYDGSIRIDTKIDERGFDRGIRSLASKSGAIVGTLGRAIGAAGIAAGAIGGVILAKGWDRLGTIESATKGLTTTLGSATKAAGLMNEVLGVVEGTPFSLDQFADAASQLVAFNVDAKKVPGVLRAIADAAAVMGGKAGTVDQLTRAFGQIASTGNVQLQDLWQITQAGVPALQILANHWGISTQAMKDLITSGAVPATEAIDALTKGIEEGSDGVAGMTRPLGGLAKELGNTLPGAAANAGTAFSRLGANIIAPQSKAIIGFLKDVAAAADAMGLVMKGDPLGSAKFDAALQKVADGLSSIATKILPPLVGGLVKVMTAIAKVLPGIVAAIAPVLITGFAEMFVALAKAIIPLMPILTKAFLDGLKVILTALPTILPALVTAFVEIIKAIVAVLPTLAPLLIEAFRVLITAIADALPVLAPVLIQGMTTLLNAMSDFNASPQGQAVAQQLIDAMAATIIASAPMIGQLGMALMRALGIAIGNGIGTVNGQVRRVSQSILVTIGTTAIGMATAGTRMVASLSRGISGAAGQALSSVSKMSASLLREIGKLPGKFASAGTSTIRSFIRGLTSIHIPMPSVSIHWSSVGPKGHQISVPTGGSVSWHAGGGVFDSSTLIGVGESGREWVLNQSQMAGLLAMVTRSVASEMARFRYSSVPASSAVSGGVSHNDNRQTVVFQAPVRTYSEVVRAQSDMRKGLFAS